MWNTKLSKHILLPDSDQNNHKADAVDDGKQKKEASREDLAWAFGGVRKQNICGLAPACSM